LILVCPGPPEPESLCCGPADLDGCRAQIFEKLALQHAADPEIGCSGRGATYIALGSDDHGVFLLAYCW
jgi:hypothetical protein